MSKKDKGTGFSPAERAAIKKALKEIDASEHSEPNAEGPDPRDEVDRIYTDDLLQKLASKYDFDLEKTRFRYWLRSGAIRFYLYNEDLPGRHPSRFAKERKSLKKQLQIVDHFQKQFELKTYEKREFKPSTPNPFFEQVERIALDAMKHKNADRLEGDIFNLYYRHRQLDTAVAERRHEIEAALEELKAHKGGRPANAGAYEFVAYLSDFWVRDMERPYTIDFHRGQGLTEAFNFIRDCATPLIPITDSQIISMMRKYRDKK